LFVDELVGQQQVVIKGLSNYVGDIGYVSGCTILGDGMVSLIIDVTGIADTVENQIEQINQGA
ncbi:MAG: chemotaxis protein CheW, partial [FCB group bacterium]|nr:chemotaxis protein CheW [FCB group bacterium]